MTEKNRIEKFLDSKNEELAKIMYSEVLDLTRIAEVVAKAEESMVPILDEVGTFFITERGEATISSPILIEAEKDKVSIRLGREVKFKKG